MTDPTLGLAEQQAAAYEALAAEARNAWKRYSALARECRDLRNQSTGSESVGQADEHLERRGEAQNRQAQTPLPASVSATPEGSQRGRNDP